MEILLFVFFGFPVISLIIHLLAYLINGRRIVGNIGIKILEIINIIIFPLLLLMFQDNGKENNCCDKNIIFSPQHRTTIYALIIICITAYFYSSYRKGIASPIIEILTNAALIIGVNLNVFIFIQLDEFWFSFIGNLPIIILFIFALIKNQQLLNEAIDENKLAIANPFNKFLFKILKLHPIIKFPLLTIIALPFFILVGSVLLLAGQKPDSIILAFTQTDHLGFSDLNSVCDNVQCGGHYLCSVAANGHNKIVKPIRFGIRGGKKIICNRQLLVANAFEELLEKKTPIFHRYIRKNYDKIGDLIHKYYWIFNVKIVSDIVYVLMKPLEWLFVIFLYIFYKNPENHISVQYLSKSDRQLINSNK